MGAKQSKRSVDITNSPSKAGEGEVIGEGEGRVVKIGDADVKAATNGSVPHKEDTEVGEKDENAKDLTAEKSAESKEKDVVEVKESKEVKENGVSDSEELKTPESDSTGDNLNESAIPEKLPESALEGKEGEATADTKKQKEKKKKKWSFRSISFSKKDKSKPSKDAEKNGDVKEVAEENAEETKSPTSESPKSEKPETPTEPTAVLNGEASKEEIADTPKAELVPTEEPKKEEPKVEEPKVDEPSVEEPKAELKVEESSTSDPAETVSEQPSLVNPPVEETKEVRNEEVPPPLPSSNPPSSLTAFAESTKADILNTETIDLLQVTTVVNPVLEKEIGEPLFEKDIVESKKDIAKTPISDSVKTSAKSEIEPNLKSPELSKSEQLLDFVDSEKSIADLSASPTEVPLKTELTTKTLESDNLVEPKPNNKALLMESKTLVLQSQVYEPSETSLQETEKSEPKATEPKQNLQPLVQEILSVVSAEPSETSDPAVTEDPLTEPSTIELNLEPLASVEIDENLELKDLQSKTDLEVIQTQAEVSTPEVPEPVEVKKNPENIALVSQENSIELKESEVTAQASVSFDFIQTPKSSLESNKAAIDQTTGPQLTPVELVIEDATPQNLEQPHSEQSLNYSEESESIDLPPPQESEQLQTSFVNENKSGLPPAPPAPITLDECSVDLPSPTDLPPLSATLVDPADSLQDISTESLPSLPEPVSENLAEPMSLPPVDSVPEPIATDCLLPESINVTTDSINKSVSSAIESVPLITELTTSTAGSVTSTTESGFIRTDLVPFANEPALINEPAPLVNESAHLASESSSLAAKTVPLNTEPVLLATESTTLATDCVPLTSDSIPVKTNPLPPTECPPVLTNGNVNGLKSSGEVSPTTNGGSILLGEATPLKQVPQEVPSEIVKDEGEKPAAATPEVTAAVEE